MERHKPLGFAERAPALYDSGRMRRFIVVAAFVGAVLCFGQADLGSQQTPLPRFEDFGVPTPRPGRKDASALGRSQPTSVGGPYETAANIRRRIRTAVRGGPDFAGHYAIMSQGCGSDCSNITIVDVQTGHIHSTPFVGVNGCLYHLHDIFSYRLDSRLFVLTGSLEIPDEPRHTFRDGPCGVHYFEWKGTTLRFLMSTLFR